jgi:hypothetical protein
MIHVSPELLYAYGLAVGSFTINGLQKGTDLSGKIF